MTAEELREKTLAELNEELVRLRRDQFNLRMQRASEQLPQTHLLRDTRRDIARVNTVMQEKVRETEAAAEGAAAAQETTAAQAEAAETEQAETTEAKTTEAKTTEAKTKKVEETVTEEPQDNAEEKADA